MYVCANIREHVYSRIVIVIVSIDARKFARAAIEFSRVPIINISYVPLQGQKSRKMLLSVASFGGGERRRTDRPREIAFSITFYDGSSAFTGVCTGFGYTIKRHMSLLYFSPLPDVDKASKNYETYNAIRGQCGVQNVLLEVWAGALLGIYILRQFDDRYSQMLSLYCFRVGTHFVQGCTGRIYFLIYFESGLSGVDILELCSQ